MLVTDCFTFVTTHKIIHLSFIKRGILDIYTIAYVNLGRPTYQQSCLKVIYVNIYCRKSTLITRRVDISLNKSNILYVDHYA